MKREKLIALLLCITVLLTAFVGCSKETNHEQTTKMSSVVYDKNGIEYSNKADLLYYDKAGNIYKLVATEEFFTNTFVNTETGEEIDAFFCYLTEDGYLYYDGDNSLARVDGTVDTYTDTKGNLYYDISTVYWDNQGQLQHGIQK